MTELLDWQRGVTEEAIGHWPEVFAFAMTLIGDRNRAEDLSQEAFLRLLTMRRRIDRQRSLLPLLLTIVRNLIRSEARRARLDSLDAEGAPAPADLEAGDPSEALEVEEECEALEVALGRLPDSWRAALYLCDGLGLPYREIAAILEKSEDTIRVTLHRARRRIRTLLKGQMPEEKR